MARGQVVCQKLDAESNPICRSNQDPTLDTHHEVEFPGGEITELVANKIAELMYAQCGVDGNEYLLLRWFIYHRKNDSALNVEEQKVVFKERETYRKLTRMWEKLSNLNKLHTMEVVNML